MSSDWPTSITRDELLGGLPARRASTLLFAIESRTAGLVARSRQAMVRCQTARSAEENERAFLEAMAQGRDEGVGVTAQDLERYAPRWSDLVPPDSSLRAALARLLGAKYLLPEQPVPGIRAALALDEPAVAQAFERLHGQPLDSIYAPSIPWRERFHWIRSQSSRRLESMPPFWTAFSLTLTETVGAGLLALPIALAGIGPIAGVIAIIVLGLVNMLTIAAVSEAVARNGSMRYGHAFYGRLVQDYLGRPGLWILTPSLATLYVLCLLAYYIGLSTTLEDATTVSAEIWAGLVFLIGVLLLRRESLNATVASALVIGAMSISLILLLAVLALPSVTSDNLRHSEVPFLDGRPFDSSILGLMFGVILMAFFGHTSAGNCAAIVLRSDPSGRAYIRGATAAIAAAMVLYVLWVLAVNGAIPADVLADESGTALAPLADEIGPSIHIVGSIFVVLAMGMASVHFTLGLVNMIREWLPNPETRIAGYGRWQSLIRQPSGRFALGMVPVAIILVIAELLLINGRESFVDPISFMGAVTASLIGGIFPMLMVVASRRKGDFAIYRVWQTVGHPVTAAVVGAIFLGGLVLHGLVIWDVPYQQAVALLGVVGTLAMIAAVLRQGAYRSRTVVEIREDPTVDAPAAVNVVAAGKAIGASVHWPDVFGRSPSGFDSVEIDLPAIETDDLRVWVHQLDPEGGSRDLPVSVEIDQAGTARHLDLRSTDSHCTVPSTRAPTHLRVGRAESNEVVRHTDMGGVAAPAPSSV